MYVAIVSFLFLFIRQDFSAVSADSFLHFFFFFGIFCPILSNFVQLFVWLSFFLFFLFFIVLVLVLVLLLLLFSSDPDPDLIFSLLLLCPLLFFTLFYIFTLSSLFFFFSFLCLLFFFFFFFSFFSLSLSSLFLSSSSHLSLSIFPLLSFSHPRLLPTSERASGLVRPTPPSTARSSSAVCTAWCRRTSMPSPPRCTRTSGSPSTSSRSWKLR